MIEMLQMEHHCGERGMISRVLWQPVVVVALAFNLLVVWLPQWLPMQDLGGHLEMMDIVARSADPATIYPELYIVKSSWVANGLGLVIAKALYPAVSPFVTAKLILSAYVVGLPLSMAFLLSAFRRPLWLMLFSVPMVFNTLFDIGLLNFLFAVPLMFMSIALAKRFVDQGSRWHGAALAVTLVVLFYAHMIAFTMGGAMVLALLLLYTRRRTDLWRLATLVPALLPFGQTIWGWVVLREPTALGETFVTASGELGTRFLPLITRLERLHMCGLRVLKDDPTDEFVVGALLLAWLVALLASFVPKNLRESESAGGSIRDRLGLPMLAVGCIVGYLVLPNGAHQVDVLAERAWMIALWLLTALPLPKGKVPSRIAFAIVALVALTYPWKLVQTYDRFSTEFVNGLPAEIASLPDKTGLLFVFDPGVVQNKWTYGKAWHLPRAIHAIENGGYSNESFMRRPYGPIDYQPGQTPPRLVPRPLTNPALFEFDHLLLLRYRTPKKLLDSSRLRLRWHGGSWWLFDVVGPREAEPG